MPTSGRLTPVARQVRQKGTKYQIRRRLPASSKVFPAIPIMLPTRALLSRSVWKGPNIVPLNIVRVPPGQKPPPIRTQARSATILPNFVGMKFQVYNGKIYNDVTITEDMVGHKLGEFSQTRKRFTYRMSKNK